MKKTRKFSTALLALSALFSLQAAAEEVVLHTNYGDIKIAVDEKHAPVSARNFLDYARQGFYNGTIFHRVIDGFMIQGGGFAVGMKKKETRAAIPNEADNGLKNLRGSVAMARTSDPDSATSQFFINLADNDFLNFSEKSRQGWGYAVFGKVTAGMDVADKIAKVETGRVGMHRDVPKQDVVIQSVTIEP
ncbi:peptidylprolyl isomerase [Pasteurellaceae bacterium LIM206]|nr:peptidylprolyl isomerase [Pasteurellaceae bacterium LIM206]